MSRTRLTLAAAVLATGALAVPAALAAPECGKPVAVAVHEAHEASEVVPVVGPAASTQLHDVEQAYCASPLPV